MNKNAATAELILTHGLPGSGKSTWAEKQVAEDPENRIRVNRDDLRTELFGEKYHSGNFPKKSESQVSAEQEKRIKAGLAKGKKVYVDDTNLNGKTVERLAIMARQYGAKISQKHFNVPVEECKRRNQARAAAGGRLVPDFVIDRMAKFAYDDEGEIKDFVISSRGKVFTVHKKTAGRKLLDEFNKKAEFNNPFHGQAVVLVDVDGTLAANQHESNRAFGRVGEKKDFAYFFSSIKDARVNQSVVNLANRMRDEEGLNLVILTGRDDAYAAELISFVERSGIKVSRIIAKREGDYRTDAEFKAEALEKLKLDGFIPVHSIDDRERSVRVYEAAGIMVSRVPEHEPVDPAVAPAEYPEPQVNSIYGSGACIRCGQPIKSGNIGPKCATKV